MSAGFAPRRISFERAQTASNFSGEEWDAQGQNHETLYRTLAMAQAAFEVAIKDKPTGRFVIRSRTRVVKWHPEGDR
jgi:hypothetical protein